MERKYINDAVQSINTERQAYMLDFNPIQSLMIPPPFSKKRDQSLQCKCLKVNSDKNNSTIKRVFIGDERTSQKRKSTTQDRKKNIDKFSFHGTHLRLD